ncbi:MAG: (2Fe-2S)-binding protein [Proteobacteria bacterium]|nr:(2Fe-2S)-binding protein [Pseudomonadota bacterium]
MPDVTIKVDGREITAKTEETLLPALLAAGFDIPHMCYNEEIKPYGACRLCIVEVEAGGRRSVVSSCSYPVSDGMVVYTDTERIKKHRRMIVELLLARCPDVKEVRDLARDVGLEHEPRFAKRDKGCILCGLCTRACEQVVGVSAISFVGRGPDKEVGTPFLDRSDVCIGCGSCYYVCPVNYVEMEDEEDVRRFPQWKVEFEKVWCERLGRKVPKKMLEHFSKIAKIPEGWFEGSPAGKK